MMVTAKQGFLEMVGKADLVSQDQELDRKMHGFRQQLLTSERASEVTKRMHDSLEAYLRAQADMTSMLKELGVKENTSMGETMLDLSQTEDEMAQPLQVLLQAHKSRVEMLGLFQHQIAEDMEATISKFESVRRQYDGYRTEAQEAEEAEKKRTDESGGSWKTRLSKVFGKKDVPCLLYTSPSPRDS
eukprot:TRINITY_DN31122_c0_g1_i1.p1 TRINITY_DN31122_c0_g1~~TRINITY_DN31122_c0_g1_i1.p1  ORF type:complete len:187 (-),score=64.17 TRINITY_DN31122_c0_g1_i1:100-660(-)